MLENVTLEIIKSWQNREGNVNSTDDIFAWITDLNENTHVKIEECNLTENSFWYYDRSIGEVNNGKKKFFSITGIRGLDGSGIFAREQPILVQPEIGYLVIICRKIDGVLNFLMQAKIEPGNVNCVQISPTIQATKSNFLRVHGGKLPTYFELFADASGRQVLYDQVQSEQASRFYKKRNRNMIMYLDEDIEIYPNFKWMTLGQIKELMKVDNLVNMDTRTVLSGLPLETGADATMADEIRETFSDQELYRSIFSEGARESLPQAFQKLNDYKMFSNAMTEFIPLSKLSDWDIDEHGITCRNNADFMVRYYNIEIDGREVQKWSQPLFKAIGMATFGFLSRVHEGKREFLVRIKPEIGSFDMAELGPAIQWEPTHDHSEDNNVDQLFRSKYQSYEGVQIDVILSEEGGRFYHEQNKNVIIYIDEEDLPKLPDDYLWVNYATLAYMVKFNNCLNIQLRNLMSLIDL